MDETDKLCRDLYLCHDGAAAAAGGCQQLQEDPLGLGHNFNSYNFTIENGVAYSCFNDK